MSHIALEGMAFYAHHGYYTHERKRGNNYILDLEDSLNYEEVYAICREEMNHARHLIEAVAKSIAIRIRERFPDSGRIAVKLEKLKPELGGAVARAVVNYELA